MSNAYAMSLTRPHESLGLHQPLGRRLPRGITAWNLAIAFVTVVCCVTYIVLVNTATTKGYSLRTLQSRVDGLQNDAVALQDKIATLSSMQALNDRATQQGFVPVDHLEFLDIAHSAVAVAR